MKKLSINRCPRHPEFWSVSIDDENGGVRLTPGKCCGQWNTVKEWPLTEAAWNEIINTIQCETSEE